MHAMRSLVTGPTCITAERTVLAKAPRPSLDRSILKRDPGATVGIGLQETAQARTGLNMSVRTPRIWLARS
jgi:hypothetical protein